MTDDAPPFAGPRTDSTKATHTSEEDDDVLSGGARYGKSRRTGDPTPKRPAADGSCCNCGRPVSSTFARVFGDNHDRVFGCFECMTISAIKEGAARTPNEETRSR